MTSKIAIRGVGRTFDARGGPFTALDGVDIEVADEEFLCIVGPSGCGKSTLLRMLGGLDRPTRGQIEVRQAQPDRPLTAMIFQEESVFPWLTVERNAAYGLRVTDTWRGRESEARVDEFLGKTGLARFRKFYPHQLSGGMKQRLSVARAFVTNPEVLLMDEPFAALDEQNKHLLQQELGRIWEENRSTVVFITHSLDEAVLLGDRVMVMTSAPGRIKETLCVPFERPRDLMELRRTPEFNTLTRELWTLLADEVERARAQEAGRVGGAGAQVRFDNEAG